MKKQKLTTMKILVLFKKYTIFQIMILFSNILISKLAVSKNIKIVRFPFLIIGKKMIDFNTGLNVDKHLRVECYGKVEIKLFCSVK